METTIMSHHSRRQFLLTGAATTAATVLPRFAIAKPGASANSKINVAVVGAADPPKSPGGKGGTAAARSALRSARPPTLPDFKLGVDLPCGQPQHRARPAGFTRGERH